MLYNGVEDKNYSPMHPGRFFLPQEFDMTNSCHKKKTGSQSAFLLAFLHGAAAIITVHGDGTLIRSAASGLIRPRRVAAGATAAAARFFALKLPVELAAHIDRAPCNNQEDQSAGWPGLD